MMSSSLCSPSAFQSQALSKQWIYPNTAASRRISRSIPLASRSVGSASRFLGDQTKMQWPSVAVNASPQTAEVSDQDVVSAVEILKNLADSNSRYGGEVIKAMHTLEKAKIKFETEELTKLIGGEESPGKPWRLIFVAGKDIYQDVVKGRRDKGGYRFPVPAVQVWDGAAMTISNGVYLNKILGIKFSGSMSVKGNVLSFKFNNVLLQLGPGKFNFSTSEEGGRFIFFYVDDEIVVARGQGGGTALWSRPTSSWLFEKGVE